MSRLIDADELGKAKFHPLPYTHIVPNGENAESYEHGWNDAIDAIISDAPTVDAVPVVHGHWIKADLDYDYVTCSNCKKLNRNDRLAFIPDYAKQMHYCMICGAKMDEVTE